MRASASVREFDTARSASLSRFCATNCSRIFAKQIVQVSSEAKARPIITSLTTMPADMNIDHGDRSCGTSMAFAVSAVGNAVGAAGAAVAAGVAFGAGAVAAGAGTAGAGALAAGAAGLAGAVCWANAGAPARQVTIDRHVIKRMVFIRRFVSNELRTMPVNLTV